MGSRHILTEPGQEFGLRQKESQICRRKEIIGHRLIAVTGYENKGHLDLIPGLHEKMGQR